MCEHTQVSHWKPAFRARFPKWNVLAAARGDHVPPSERQRCLRVGTGVASRLSLILLLRRGISVERSRVEACGVLSCQGDAWEPVKTSSRI